MRIRVRNFPIFITLFEIILKWYREKKITKCPNCHLIDNINVNVLFRFFYPSNKKRQKIKSERTVNIRTVCDLSGEGKKLIEHFNYTKNLKFHWKFALFVL